MKEYIEIIKDSALFKGINENDILALLDCLLAKGATYSKNEYIFRSGDSINYMGLVVSGSVHIIKDDYWGNQTIITNVLPTNIFGETYAFVPSEPLEISAIATSDCTILFLDINKILTTCHNSCKFHTLLIHNFMTSLAMKNLMLTKKIEHTSKRTIREKLLSYLSSESLKSGSSSFQISYNRQQLADYLSIDRSAMSSELGKLRDEGVLTFHKNNFTLISM